MNYLRFSTGRSRCLVEVVLPDTEHARKVAQASARISVFPHSFPHSFFGRRHFVFSGMSAEQSVLHKSYY